MPLLKQLSVLSRYCLGNQDKKKISKTVTHDFKDIKNFQIIKTREKYTIITENNKPVFFSIDDKSYLYTLKASNENKSAITKYVLLNEGAFKPILNGANVMSPGIYKYKDSLSEVMFNKGDYVYVMIDERFVGVGIAQISLSEINEETKGVGIEIIHCLDDALDKMC